MDDAAIERGVILLASLVATAGGALWLVFGVPRQDAPPRSATALSPRSAEPYRGPVGVVKHDPERSAGGLNLVVSRHAVGAVLLDMNGAELQRWTAPWPDPRSPVAAWRRARMLPGGGLVALCEAVGVLAVDPMSQDLWHRRLLAHGTFEVAPNGGIVVLTRPQRNLEDISHMQPVADDVLVWLDSAGEEVAKTSLFDAFRRSSNEAWRDVAAEGGPLLDVAAFHTIGAGFAAPFFEGHVLLAVRRLGLVAVVDPASGLLTWSVSGPWGHPVDAHATANGGLLVADEVRVVEVDVATLSVRWEYPAKAENVQRLANGNTLIVESAVGRAVEVTPDGLAVWEYINTHLNPADPSQPAWLDVQRLPGGA